jgi:hypothetical protein
MPIFRGIEEGRAENGNISRVLADIISLEISVYKIFFFEKVEKSWI